MRDEATGGKAPEEGLSRGWSRLEELSSSERHYRRIVEQAGMGIWALDDECRTTFVNRELNRLLGFPSGSLIGGSAFDLLRPQQARAAHVGIERRKRNGQTEVHELEVLRRDGTWIWLSATLTPIYAENGGYSGSLAIVHDITERQRVTEAARRGERLRATSTLAGGIAHTFNNLMLGIMGNAELLQQDIVPGEDKPEMLEAIADSARRAGTLANQLLAYAQGGRYVTEVLDLNRLIADTLDVQPDLVPQDVALRLKLSEDPRVIEGDPSQLELVLLNLCRNSIEAVEDAIASGRTDVTDDSGHSGLVVVSTDRIEIEEPIEGMSGEPLAGDFTTLTVEDTGAGMSREAREHAFEPFYSTRSLGRGLGLAAVHGIVINHGGGIVLESDLGRGTAVTVYLPNHR